MKHVKAITIVLLGLLSACGSTDVKETLGLNHRAPDEFRVYQHPPLSVPPDFALRPPEKGSDYPSGLPADAQARNKVLTDTGATALPANAPATVTAASPTMHFLVAPVGSVPATTVMPVTTSPLPTSADAQFLANAGANKADPNIRTEIERDSGASISSKNSAYLLGNKKEGDSLVDPTKEADRLKQDKAQNQPPTAGETPVVEQKDKGWLGDIF